MTKPKLILDVDTGSDDAVALALAMLGGEAELLGITTVNGNLELKLTTDNTLRVVDLCGMGDRVPVYPGCEYPLVSTLNPVSYTHLDVYKRQRLLRPTVRWACTTLTG